MAKLCDDDVNILTIKPISIKTESAHGSGSLHIYSIQEENCATANSEAPLFNAPVDCPDNIHRAKSEEMDYKDCSILMSVMEEFIHSDNSNVGVTATEINIKQENHKDTNTVEIGYDVCDVSQLTANMKPFTSSGDFVIKPHDDECDGLMRPEFSTAHVSNFHPYGSFSIKNGRADIYETISDKLHVRDNKSIKSEITDANVVLGPSDAQITKYYDDTRNKFGGSSACSTITCDDTYINNPGTTEIQLPSPDVYHVKDEYIDIAKNDQLAIKRKENMSHTDTLQVNTEFNYLPEYLQPHGGEANHLCNICSERFPCSSDNKHSDDLPTTDEAHSCFQFCRSLTHSNCQSPDRNTVTVKKSYSCATCKKNFSSPYHLKRHIMTHTTDKTQACPQCNKSFSRSDILKSRMLAHSGENPHTCPQCRTGFTHASNLKTRMLIHSGKKPHTCPQCNKSFAQVCNMKTHLMTHSGEKPHKCPHCNKSFTQVCNLKAHIMTHTGEKPHICPHCNMKFSRPDSLRKHMMIHSGERPHRCPPCNKGFVTTNDLKRHIVKSRMHVFNATRDTHRPAT